MTNRTRQQSGECPTRVSKTDWPFVFECVCAFCFVGSISFRGFHGELSADATVFSRIVKRFNTHCLGKPEKNEKGTGLVSVLKLSMWSRRGQTISKSGTGAGGGKSSGSFALLT